jgi:hypothetical protein
MRLKFLIPFAIFIHTIAGFQFAQLSFVCTGILERFSLFHVHVNVVQIGNLEFCQRVGAFRAY